ncbi:MAG TPA: DUF2905 domain-containing protein [Thermodesulfobacteriota bacterium]|nr:DUF2905 domain-containing protein [Thermodesulfobacteriota bacterium]
MEGIGKSLIITGLLLIVIGVAIAFGPRIPFIGKLPGDIYIKKDSFTFYFPLASSILISVTITLIMYLFRK